MDVTAITAAAGPRTELGLRQPTNVSGHNAYSTASPPKELLRKQPVAPSIDRGLAKEKPGRILGRRLAKKMRGRREQSVKGQREVGRVS